ncbi:hypothetical protein Csa_015266 [Cucumis sativus]|nr:hypothetical protein Csa_015266 [Cucumis sativus]
MVKIGGPVALAVEILSGVSLSHGHQISFPKLFLEVQLRLSQASQGPSDLQRIKATQIKLKWSKKRRKTQQYMNGSRFKLFLHRQSELSEKRGSESSGMCGAKRNACQ